MTLAEYKILRGLIPMKADEDLKILVIGDNATYIVLAKKYLGGEYDSDLDVLYCESDDGLEEFQRKWRAGNTYQSIREAAEYVWEDMSPEHRWDHIRRFGDVTSWNLTELNEYLDGRFPENLENADLLEVGLWCV